ncbi:MAG: ABC transporter substrate-binding protein [Gammaproteobacteria bacterium]
MLRLENVAVSYGSFRALNDISLHAEQGELVVLLGANGAGKSSIFLAMSGLQRAGGSIRFGGRELVGRKPSQIVADGLVHCPEGRKLFPGMNVTGAFQFRVTRDSELWVQEEDVEDLLNALKQAVQFGLDKRTHLAGANIELEVLEGLPPEARIGDWVAEWYHIQPGVPHVDEFVEAIKKKTGRVPTARTWFGFVGTWSCALAANKAKSLDAVKMARALDGMELPPEVGLMPNTPFYRANQHQLIGSLYVGHAQAKGSAPEDLFHVDRVINGIDVAGTVEESGCKMTWPS